MDTTWNFISSDTIIYLGSIVYQTKIFEYMAILQIRILAAWYIFLTYSCITIIRVGSCHQSLIAQSKIIVV